MPVHPFPSRPKTTSQPSRPSVRPAGRKPWILWGAMATVAGALIAIPASLCWHGNSVDLRPNHPLRWSMVLDGSGTGGDRPFRALELMRAGAADSLLISGSQIFPDIWSSTLWVRVLNLTAAEKSRVVELRHGASSTWGEATAATAFFRERKVDTVLVITSDFHTERAQSILDRVSQGNPVYLVTPSVAATNRSVDDRETRKTWLLESAKRIHWWTYERWFAKPLAVGAIAEVPWMGVSGENLGSSPVLNAPTVSCPPPVVCPPAPRCPACPPCKEAVKPAAKPAAKAAATEKAKPKAKEPAKSDKKPVKKS